MAEAVIGALAADIRGDWNDTKYRVSLIADLSRFFHLNLESELEEWDGSDGRWFRDCWSGPYGNCTRQDLIDACCDEYIFSYPASVITDY